jgi:hypothetical protein
MTLRMVVVIVLLLEGLLLTLEEPSLSLEGQGGPVAVTVLEVAVVPMLDGVGATGTGATRVVPFRQLDAAGTCLMSLILMSSCLVCSQQQEHQSH